MTLTKVKSFFPSRYRAVSLGMALVPLLLAFTDRPTYRIFVGAESSDAIFVIDGATHEVVDRIPLGVSVEEIEGPHGLAISPDARYLYVSLAHGWPYGSLWKFTTEGKRLEGRATLGLFPATTVLSPDGVWAFVANYNLHGDPRVDLLSVVHTPSMTEVGQIPTCEKPHGLDVSPDGRFVMVGCTGDDGLVKVDVDRFQVVGRMSVSLPGDPPGKNPCDPAGVVVGPEGRLAYVSCLHLSELRVVDTEKMEVVGKIAVGQGPYLLKLDPAGRRLFVPLKKEGALSVVDLNQQKEIARIPASHKLPHTVAFSPDGRYAYLSQESVGLTPGAVDVVDLEKMEVVKTIDTGLLATGIGVAVVP